MFFMKKYILLVGLAFGIWVTGLAQELRLNGYSGYVFDDQFETFNSDISFLDGTIRGGYQWGVGLEYLPSDYYGVELMYYRQDTKVPVNYYDRLIVSRTLDASINYIMLGAMRYAGTDWVQGYVSPMAGLVIYDNKDPQPSEPNSYTRFTWGIKLGGEYLGIGQGWIENADAVTICCPGYWGKFLPWYRRFRCRCQHFFYPLAIHDRRRNYLPFSP